MTEEQKSLDVINTDLDYIIANLKNEFASLSGKKLLITGGAGFLGYYLVQSALQWNRLNKSESGIELTIYDNYIRGVPDWLDKMRGDRNLILVTHDMTEPLPGDIDDFDYIIHAASIASPSYYRKYPIETMDANIRGLRFLLDYCCARKENGKPVQGFLFYSSSEIYGNPPPEHIPTPETYYGNVSCTGPRACYDEAKRYGETLCVNFARQYGIPIKTARPFNNYGPGLKISDKRVFPDFAKDVLAGRDIVMLSDGSPKRTFCYIADAVIGYYKILIKGAPASAYNIGVESPEISILELAENVAKTARELFGYKGRIIRKTSNDTEYLSDNPTRRCPDITKAREDLGYSPGVSLDEGIKRSLIWYAANPEAEDA